MTKYILEHIEELLIKDRNKNTKDNKAKKKRK